MLKSYFFWKRLGFFFWGGGGKKVFTSPAFLGFPNLKWFHS